MTKERTSRHANWFDTSQVETRTPAEPWQERKLMVLHSGRYSSIEDHPCSQDAAKCSPGVHRGYRCCRPKDNLRRSASHLRHGMCLNHNRFILMAVSWVADREWV